MKYDFNTNLIFVLRSGSQNGLVDDTANSTALTSVQLDILDATTGQRIKKGGEAINACLLYTSDAADDCWSV